MTKKGKGAKTENENNSIAFRFSGRNMDLFEEIYLLAKPFEYFSLGGYPYVCNSTHDESSRPSFTSKERDVCFDTGALTVNRVEWAPPGGFLQKRETEKIGGKGGKVKKIEKN